MEVATIIDGTIETKVGSWLDLQRFTKYFSDDLGFIFRGQGDSDWNLVPSLERYMYKLPVVLQNDSIYKEQLTRFKESLRGRGVNHLGLDNNELWALGQHYGLFTPLLDWSFSLHISLYFTFIDETPPKNGFRAIYALHKQKIEEKAEIYNMNKNEYDKFEIIESMSNQNIRIINQAGLFTKMPFKFNLKNWIIENFKGDNESCYYFKILIPNSERMRILRELNLMNINPNVIYPDLQGASLNCNHMLELKSDKVRSGIYRP